jgi:hypothetical protein
LLSKGWRSGAGFQYLEQEGSQYDEISWASCVEEMLTFLCGRKANAR